jgi:predicted enzyme related to lactoylglutathione lyase
MERAIGIGGFFFRAQDPEGLGRWYEEHFGIPASGTPWTQEGGMTVWSPFAADTTYFGRPEKQWMVNFRVRDLDAMLAQLRAAGAAVEDTVQEEDYGRFGWLSDPEGNRIELWEPPADQPT